MSERSGMMPMPPETNSRSVPSRSFTGNPLPMGPRMPTVSPSSSVWITAVTLPALRIARSKYPSCEGDDVMEIGTSPTPGTSTITNWPGA